MIELERATKVYGRGAHEVHALRGVSFAIARGSFVAIVGPSGSGKSTLLNLLGALDQPTAGEVRIEGVALSTLDDAGRTRLRRDRIGFVFQFFNLLPTLTALENVLLPARLGGRYGAELEGRARALLERLGLGRRTGHRPDQLSGGEMQRVAIARALALDPALVLADEPTGNLDSRTGEEILDVLRGAASVERTVVIVTHDPRIAARADRVIAIRDGAMEYDGPATAWSPRGPGAPGAEAPPARG